MCSGGSAGLAPFNLGNPPGAVPPSLRKRNIVHGTDKNPQTLFHSLTEENVMIKSSSNPECVNGALEFLPFLVQIPYFRRGMC